MGPRGGDELNVVERGLNYGWPVISFGRNYAAFSNVTTNLPSSNTSLKGVR